MRLKCLEQGKAHDFGWRTTLLQLRWHPKIRVSKGPSRVNCAGWRMTRMAKLA